MRKNVLTGIAFSTLFLLLILGIAMKDKLNDYLSQAVMNQVDDQTKNSSMHIIDSLYNYTLNERSYEYTFLEFGAEGCISCRKMKTVMEQVKQSYPDKVNVVFVNTLQAENQDIMNLFGIVGIPAQILLDKEGKMFYRNTGYIPFEDLSKYFN